ncbi:LysR family transcriptional regulator [Streptomyces hoynatensis]|uniref:LysR family transcriptional regulator n=1 Tax=Streptomyces hoynatensis TaxID=1141874 RepID=A0A3A9YWN6_9ACTN|nr:LysR family transcriptional regulator [Streptomyces hoynatensis]RKN40034.1 LysR family transcriptional regulator [Streptomyces hoynatensis]
MDLDLNLVRGFVVTAETLHFGRAASRMGTSQQALSKRIARLESLLDVRLFERTAGTRLTPAGERFLPAAREALSAGERAVAAARGDTPAVRIDVWGHLYAPLRTVAEVAQALDVQVEPGPGRDWPSVAQALSRGDTDLGFGRAHPLPTKSTAGLAERVVRLEPVDALVGPYHPLAGSAALRPAELRDSTLCCPAELDRLDFLRQFADAFGVARWQDGPNLGLEHLVRHVQADPACFTLFPADAPLPGHASLRSIPLVDPTPLYAWSVIWRSSPRHPLLDAVLDGFARTGGARRWLDYRPGRDWLPDADLARLRPGPLG